jgi:hypothetical protein
MLTLHVETAVSAQCHSVTTVNLTYGDPVSNRGFVTIPVTHSDYRYGIMGDGCGVTSDVTWCDP